MNTADVLRKALSYIDAPGKWTKGAFARDALGRAVHYRSPNATCFCLAGAIMNVVDELESRILMLKTLGLELGYSIESHQSFVVQWEDEPERTHEEVVAVFRKAIARAETAHANP